jgi:PEP-CTERM motif
MQVSKYRSTLLLSLAVAFLLVVSGPIATANPLNLVINGSASVNGFYVYPPFSGITTVFYIPQNLGPNPSANGSGSVINGGIVSASAQALFSSGTLKAIASTSATSSDPTTYAEADASAVIRFDDQFMLVSSTLPAGSQVTITEELGLHDSISSSSNTGGACSSASAVGDITLTGFGLTLDDSGCGLTPTASTTVTMDLGTVADIYGSLTVQSTSFAEFSQGFGTSSSNTADAFDTGSFYIYLPPGVTLISASGATYAPPTGGATPEPGTLLLLGSGLMVFAPFVRRKFA